MIAPHRLLVTSVPVFVLGALAAAQDEPTAILELSIEDSVALAIGNNLDLRIAELESEAAQFDSLGSWGTFDWVFDASVGWVDNTQKGSGFLSGGDEVDTTTTSQFVGFSKATTTGGSFNATFDSRFTDTNNVFANDPRQAIDTLNLSYTQPLRRGAWSNYATSQQRESELTFQRSRELQRAMRQQVAHLVQVEYWDLVSAIEQRGVAESAVELAQNQLEQEQRELDAGVGTEIDVVQAQSDVATREEDLIRTQNEVVQSMDDLRAMLFVSQDDRLWRVEIVPVTVLPAAATMEGVPDWTSALFTALELRTELRQRRFDIDIAKLRHQRTISERMGGLDLTVGVVTAAVDRSGTQALEETFGIDFPRYEATLSYNIPLGNRAAANAERAAEADVRRANLDYDREELRVTTSVRTALRNVAFAVEQVRASKTSLDLAQRQLDAEEARQAEGMSTTFQVLEFQQTLIEAMSNERTMRASFVKALAELENAQGKSGGGR